MDTETGNLSAKRLNMNNKRSTIIILILFAYLISIIAGAIVAIENMNVFTVDNEILSNEPGKTDPSKVMPGKNDYRSIVLEHNLKKVGARDKLRLRVYDTSKGDDNSYLTEQNYSLDGNYRQEIKLNLEHKRVKPFLGKTYVAIFDLTRNIKTDRYPGAKIDVFYHFRTIDKTKDNPAQIILYDFLAAYPVTVYLTAHRKDGSGMDQITGELTYKRPGELSTFIWNSTETTFNPKIHDWIMPEYDRI